MSTQLLLIGAGGFIAMGTFRLTDPLLPAIADEFGTSIGSVATTVTAFTVGYGLFQLLYGPLGDRIGKLRVMSVALALSALATTLCAWTDSVNALAVLRFMAGMTAGAIVPLSIAHIGDTVQYDTRQTTIGRFLSATMMGQIVGGSLAGMFAEYFGWRLAFIAFGVTGILVALRLGVSGARAPRPAPRDPAQAKVTHLGLLRLSATRIVWGAVFLEGCFLLGAIPYTGAYLRHGFGLDYLSIGLVLGSFGIGGLVYSALVRLMVARLGERGMVITGGILVAASYFCLMLAPAWQYFIPALALIGMGFFTMHSTLQTRATELAPQARGTALSGFSMCLFMGQGSGVFAMSYLIDGPGYVAAFAIAGSGGLGLVWWLNARLGLRHVPGGTA